MEPKRELTSVDIAALGGELADFEGARVDKAYLYGEDLVRFRLRHPEHDRVELLVEVGDVKRVHVAAAANVPDAPERPPDFAMMLRNRIGDASFVGAEQYEFDRILELAFEGREGRTTVVAELFGEGNLAVVDSTGRVVDCLRPVRLKSRTVVPGGQYEYPSSRVNPLAVPRDAFAARMADSDTDVVRTLATQLNLGGTYAEELCTRAGVPKTLPIEDADDAAYSALFDSLRDLAADVDARRFDPRVYAEDGTPVDVTPFPLEERSHLEATRYGTFNEALDAYFHARTAEGREPDRPDFQAEIEKHERIVDQQESAIDRFAEEADAERGRAELLYEHYGVVDDVLSTVRAARADGHGWEAIEERLAVGADRGITAAEIVRGVEPADGTVVLSIDGVRVEVDPSMGVEQNADRLYTAAKEIEAKREGAIEALEETREALEALRRRRDEWDAEPDDGGGDGAGRDVDWSSRSSVPVNRPDTWYDRFRWFHTSDGFLVLGGRNADQNEELAKKYLEPTDRFLHAQAHGAPVTVLKATGPSEAATEVDFPDRTLEQAAQFAVSYSSTWRDGHYSGDVYMVRPDQVSKTPESGEYVEKGSFVIRGDRRYFRDTPVGCAVGVQCEPVTRIVGGPPDAIRERTAVAIGVEPGRYARSDAAKRLYRTLRESFADTAFVRKLGGTDEIARFLPPGGSRIVDG